MTSLIIPKTIRSILPHKFEVQIPRIIHQTYKSIEEIPDVWKNTPASWKQQHPDWKYVFWSDADCLALVKERYPWFLKTYNRYDYAIQRADAIRPMFMHTFGGLYVDLDIEAIRPLDELFCHKSDIYLIRTQNTGIVTNCIMASEPGCKFWLRVLEEMVARAENPNPFAVGKHWLVMNTTGPMLLDYMVNEYSDKFTFKFLPRDLLMPCDVCTPKPCSTPWSYTRLLEGCSWIEWDTRIYNYLMCGYKQIISLIFLAIIIYCFYHCMRSNLNFDYGL